MLLYFQSLVFVGLAPTTKRVTTQAGYIKTQQNKKQNDLKTHAKK